MVRKIGLLLLVLASAIFFSCKKDNNDSNNKDRGAPLVSGLSPYPGGNNLYHTGQQINFRATFLDDKELVSYTVKVVNTFPDSFDLTQTVRPWEETFTGRITGKNAPVTITMSIAPNVAAGWYKLIIQCLDGAGFLSEESYVGFTVLNTADMQEPNINLYNPNGTQNVSPGGSIQFDGYVTDNEILTSLKLRLYKKDDNALVYQRDTLFPTQINPTDSFNFNYLMPIDAFLPVGLYEARLYAKDDKNNTKRRNFDVNVN